MQTDSKVSFACVLFVLVSTIEQVGAQVEQSLPQDAATDMSCERAASYSEDDPASILQSSMNLNKLDALDNPTQESLLEKIKDSKAHLMNLSHDTSQTKISKLRIASLIASGNSIVGFHRRRNPNVRRRRGVAEGSLMGCVDKHGVVDSSGEGCSWYEQYPQGCGKFDDDDFKSSTQCCACQAYAACEDSSNGALDSEGDGCSWYTNVPKACGMFDDGDFKAKDMCCACKLSEPASCSFAGLKYLGQDVKQYACDRYMAGVYSIPYAAKVGIEFTPDCNTWGVRVGTKSECSNAHCKVHWKAEDMGCKFTHTYHGSWMAMIKSFANHKCLFWNTRGFPLTYDWGKGNEYCGVTGGQEWLLSNKYHWKINRVTGNYYMFSGAADGKCLTNPNFRRRGQYYTTRYNWDASKPYCGADTASKMIRTYPYREAVWELLPVYDPRARKNRFLIKSLVDKRCLLSTTYPDGRVMKQARWKYSSRHKFCGFLSSSQLLAHKQFVWDIEGI